MSNTCSALSSIANKKLQQVAHFSSKDAQNTEGLLVNTFSKYIASYLNSSHVLIHELANDGSVELLFHGFQSLAFHFLI